MISAQSVNVKTMAGNTQPPVPRQVLEIPWIAQIEKAAERRKNQHRLYIDFKAAPGPTPSIGSTIRKVEPCPTTLSSSIRPPWLSTMR